MCTLSLSLRNWTLANLSQVNEVVPDVRFGHRLRHQVSNLLLGVRVANDDLRRVADLEEPVHIDAMCPGQVAKDRGPQFWR